MTENLRSRILDWAGPNFPLEVREEAVRAYNDFIEQKKSELCEYYSSELEFGTGGLRGVLGNGAGRMNRWTVGRATLALCNVLRTEFKKPSIVIAYDSRRQSVEFAEVAAGIAAANGFQVYIFDGVTPTPILSYAVRKLKASGGIVITASHNPPEYNGFKAYLSDGSQLVGDVQKKIEAEIKSLSDWGQIPFLEKTDTTFTKKVTYIRETIRDSYTKELEKTIFGKREPKSKKLRVAYTPLHGTGGEWMPQLLAHFGFHIELVEEQARPDGEFPTVKYPNPEESEALKLGIETAKAKNCDLLLATDPDADRLGVGVRMPDGNFLLINGNQIGSILSAFLCEKVLNDPTMPTGVRWNLFKTIVTTDLQSRIAKANNVAIHDVLTGFKYIAEQMRFVELKDKKFGYDSKDRYLFGGEESFGYLPVDFVRDKDSLSSALLLCKVAAEVGNLADYLDQLYLKYGLYLEDLKSITMKGADGQKKIGETINGLRTTDWSGMVLGERKIVEVLDYEKQTVNGKPDSRFEKIPKSNVIQFILSPEAKLTIRPSGTEPKVKLYASLRHAGSLVTLEELAMAKSSLENELASISGIFLAKTGLAG